MRHGVSSLIMGNDVKTNKPRLRGYLHQEAFFFAAGACALLIAKATSGVSIFATSVYSATLMIMFGVSAIYHRPQWHPRPRAIMKRLDHSSIFLLIAGTATPVALLALPRETGRNLMLAIWSGALVGVVQSIFFPQAPKWVSACLAILVGWISLPFLGALIANLSSLQIWLLVVGGILYTLGALAYAFKKPNFFPSTFGYHELFHLLTILAAAMHFIVVFKMVA